MRAVVFGPEAHHRREAIAWCQRHGHEVVAVARGAASALAVLSDGRADVVVVARQAHVRDVAPHVVVVTDQSGPGPRRTWRLPRDGAAP
jgi:AmiR/NasT family two-component response regulator